MKQTAEQRREEVKAHYAELMEELEGREILSMNYEGCVGVKEGKVIREGEVIDTLDTNKKISNLFGELFYNEFGTMNPNGLM